MSRECCIFWDNSNIFLPAKEEAAEREGTFAEREVRIDFRNLVTLASAGRSVQRAVCVRSISSHFQREDAMTKRIESLGFRVETYERGMISRREQAVDQSLQVHMVRAALQIRPPTVAVLLTGDGAGYESGVGFHSDLELLYQAGWGIEVLSWERVCNPRLRAWADSVGVFIRLEDYYESCTFLEGGRFPKPVNLKRRKTADPRGNPGSDHHLSA